MQKQALLSLLAAAALLSGCYSHVNLSADPSASPSQRLQAYKELRPVARVHNIHVTVTRSSVSVNENQQLVLGNGLRVFHGEDLLPVVPKTSPTAQYVRKAQSYNTVAWWVTGIATVLGIAGSVVGVIGHSKDNNGMMMGGFIGGGAALGIGMAVAMGLSFAEKNAKRTAFATYPRDLRRFLDLCVRDKTVMPCSQKPTEPAGQPPAEPETKPSQTPASPTVAPGTPKSALLKGLRFATFKRRTSLAL